MSKKLSSTTSIMKQLPKENIYNNIKSPMDVLKKKESSNTDLSTQINNFQKEPNTNFMSSLQNRVPTNTNFQIQKPVDYGLTKDLISKGQFSLDNSGITSSLLNKRISNNGSFKQSKGIPSLDAHFDRFMPKDLDYRYVDPQTYEYKLKGMTQNKMIRNAMQEEGVNDDTINNPYANLTPAEKSAKIREQKALEETLDPTTRAKRWREQALAEKATKVQKVFRGFNDKQNIKEGLNEIVPTQTDDSSSSDNKVAIQDVIKAGKAKRKHETERYNYHQNAKEDERNHQKHLDEQIKVQAKFEDFRMKNDKLSDTQALQLFAKQTPHYQRYLTDRELDKLDEINDYDKLSKQRKLYLKLKGNEATKPDAAKMKNKAGTLLNKNLNTLAEKRIATKRLKEYQEVKRDYGPEQAELFARERMAVKPKAKKRDEIIQGAEETKGEEKAEEEPKKQHNLRSKSEISKQITKKKTKEKEPEAQFIDGPETKKEPIELSSDEQKKVDKQHKKIDQTLEELNTKIPLVTDMITKIQSLGKTNSKTKAPEQMRKELNKIYAQHGKNYHANTNLQKVYQQLETWNEDNNALRESKEAERHKVIHTVVGKRTLSPKKAGKNKTPAPPIEEGNRTRRNSFTV